MFNPDYLVFYTDKNDWQDKVKQIYYKNFDENTMKLLDVSEELINQFNDMAKRANYKNIRIRYKNKPSHTRALVKVKNFDPRKMDLIYVSKEEQDKINEQINNALKDGKSPFKLISSEVRNNTVGLTYNGKIDEGAVGNYLDTTLDGAKKRAVNRQKRYGSSFRKNSYNRVPIKKR